MRSAISALLAALALAGCGNWSNDDVAFVQALPTAQALRVALPASAGQALCAPPGPSEVWAFAKPAGDGLNALVDGLAALVDRVRAVPPTTRGADARTWGPFPDDRHPGVEVRVVMTRAPASGGAPTTYTYAFEARRAGGAWQTALDGTLRGESARTGSGTFALHFATLRALAIDDHPDTDPAGDVALDYDRTGDPRTVGLAIVQPPQGGPLAAFDYGWAAYESGRGFFHYSFTNQQAQQYVVDAHFDADGRGRADVTVVLAPALRLSFSECWDATGCVTNVEDAFAGSRTFPDGLSKLCTGGVCPTGSCPAL